MSDLQYEWDPEKAELNRRKHGVSFELACHVFEDPQHLSVQDRHVDGEERWVSIGLVGAVLVLVVAHTVRERDGSELIRIISARRATSGERRRYATGT